jgi:N-acetylglucosaminyl-diphospho-decaprenol L-rhamnosyltransferase
MTMEPETSGEVRQPAAGGRRTEAEPTIYVPNFNGSARLRRLLESLGRQSAPFRVVVVDNGSSDDSVAMLADRFPEAEVAELRENLGFGRALNRAIAEHGGELVMLLNNDVVCEPRFVEEMLAAMTPDVEMVAGVLVRDDAPDLIDSAGVVADRRTLLAFDYLHGRPREAATRARPPLAPTGGAALYRREAFESVGGFDERIFAYYEDLDLGLRLQAAGARCGLAGEALARHAYSATLKGDPAAKYALTGWSRGYLLRRYGVLRTPGAVLLTALCEVPICAGQIVLDRTTRGVRGRIEGWRAAEGLPHRELPELPTHVSLRRALRHRLARRRQVAP